MLSLFTHPGEHSTPASLGLLALRLGAGLSMALGHGWGKLTTFAERSADFPDPLGVSSPVSLALAIGAEFFCGLLVAAGLFTRWACIPLIFTMVVAAFIIHGADPFSTKELALLYLFSFITILGTGAGRFSVDAVLVDR